MVQSVKIPSGLASLLGPRKHHSVAPPPDQASTGCRSKTQNLVEDNQVHLLLTFQHGTALFRRPLAPAKTIEKDKIGSSIRQVDFASAMMILL